MEFDEFPKATRISVHHSGSVTKRFKQRIYLKIEEYIFTLLVDAMHSWVSCTSLQKLIEGGMSDEVVTVYLTVIESSL